MLQNLGYEPRPSFPIVEEKKKKVPSLSLVEYIHDFTRKMVIHLPFYSPEK